MPQNECLGARIPWENVWNGLPIGGRGRRTLSLECGGRHTLNKATYLRGWKLSPRTSHTSSLDPVTTRLKNWCSGG